MKFTETARWLRLSKRNCLRSFNVNSPLIRLDRGEDDVLLLANTVVIDMASHNQDDD